MKPHALLLASLFAIACHPAWGWSNHTLIAYRVRWVGARKEVR